MHPYRWTRQRGCAAALRAVDKIEAEFLRGRTLEAEKIGRLCSFIERGVGDSDGVAEKLVLLYAEARALENPDGASAAELERARRVSLSTCGSLRTIIDRLCVQ